MHKKIKIRMVGFSYCRAYRLIHFPSLHPSFVIPSWFFADPKMRDEKLNRLWFLKDYWSCCSSVLFFGSLLFLTVRSYQLQTSFRSLQACRDAADLPREQDRRCCVQRSSIKKPNELLQVLLNQTNIIAAHHIHITQHLHIESSAGSQRKKR